VVRILIEEQRHPFSPPLTLSGLFAVELAGWRYSCYCFFLGGAMVILKIAAKASAMMVTIPIRLTSSGLA
jgi:hypothetical protein